MRTIIISDIHGCIKELNEMLLLIDYKSPNTRIISVGDLIDRGEDSLAVIRRIRELKIETVMANHELKFIKWFRHGKNSNRR